MIALVALKFTCTKIHILKTHITMIFQETIQQYPNLEFQEVCTFRLLANKDVANFQGYIEAI